MKKINKIIIYNISNINFHIICIATQNGGIVRKREEKINANNAKCKTRKTEMVSKDKNNNEISRRQQRSY